MHTLDTRQPQTTLANHSFIESLTSSEAAWVNISKLVTTFRITSLLTTLLVYTSSKALSSLFCIKKTQRLHRTSGYRFCYVCLRPHDRPPIWCVLVEPMVGPHLFVFLDYHIEGVLRLKPHWFQTHS